MSTGLVEVENSDRLASDGPAPLKRESFGIAGGYAYRDVVLKGIVNRTTVSCDAAPGGSSAQDRFDEAWLRSPEPPKSPGGEPFRIVDLFSGCGAMTLGAAEACRAVGLTPHPVLAVDINEKALGVYAHNFPTAEVSHQSVTELLDGAVGGPRTERELELSARLGDVDLVIGGPPCQGHSDLNNHTRRDDPRNTLYLSIARFAEVVLPRRILIENVPGVRHDRGRVVAQTIEILEGLGYTVWTRLLHAERFGVPQRRRRYFVAATLAGGDETIIESLEHASPRPLSWAIGDLIDAMPGENRTFDTSARHYAQNDKRIKYLFDNGLHDLPNEQRPDCHRTKSHSYNSVYGRMFWDRPTQTVTTGFGSTGQGRYVHPLRPRTMSPHEAARVQFIPDFFRFPETGRRALQEMIGNAVPPRLAYVMTLSMLGG